MELLVSYHAVLPEEKEAFIKEMNAAVDDEPAKEGKKEELMGSDWTKANN